MIWAQLIAQYGLPFVIELTRLIENKENPTSQDFLDLKAKYGTKTPEQYLSEAGGEPLAKP